MPHVNGKKQSAHRNSPLAGFIGLGFEQLEGRVMLTSAPVITPGSLAVTPGSLFEGTTLATLNGSFSDADAADSHTASINWGDGAITAGVVTSGGGGGSVHITFDYSLDANNFFDTQAKKDLLQAVADSITSRFSDTLTAITPGGGNSWTVNVTNPATNATTMISNPSIAANEIVIYAGGRDIPGSTLGIGGPNGWSGSGSGGFLANVSERGQGAGTTTGAGATDFAPFGGSITFDTGATWWFGGAGDTSGLAGKNDFLSVATHELCHALGFGTSASFTHFTSGSNFTGPASVAEHGGNVPLSGDLGHWAASTFDGGFETVMDPSITVGTRKTMTPLDFAGLDDLGWTVTSANTLSGTHTYADNGSYTISVTVSDPSLTSTAVTKNVSVTNVAPTLTISSGGGATEGSVYTLNLSHSDPGTDTITGWNITWGDGSPVEHFAGASPTPTHTYADPGLKSISATATDEDGTFSSNVLGQNIANVAPTLSTISNLSGASEDTDFSISYATLLAASNAADAGGGTVNFRIESVNSGTLKKGVASVIAGSTTLASGETLTWHGPIGGVGLVNAFSVKAYDGTAASSTSIAVNINTVTSNHSPTLPASPVPFVLTGVDEDSVTTGSLVSAILTTAGYADVDAGALSGIAVTAASANGNWQYATDGTSWTNFGAVSSSAALLLSSTTQIRFQPDSFNGETATFTFRAWDQTSGTASINFSPSTASATSNGGASAFSANTGQAGVTITSVNDAPSIPSAGTIIPLTGTNEDTTSSGTLVSAILSGVSSTDVDTSALTGIAVVSAIARGAWQFSTNNIDWTDFGAVASINALLLSPTARVRYVPDSTVGETASFDFRAWDQTSDTASTNGSPSKASTSPSGGTTAFSVNTASAQIVVTDVNDAPVVPDVTTPYEMNATDEDSTSQLAFIGDILDAAGVTDVDGATNGMAVTATTGTGTWQYSTNGSTWTAFGAVSNSSALLLAGTDAVRYIPAGTAGETATFSYRAWDQSAGTASTFGAPSKSSTAVTGGTTAFSNNTSQVNISVTDVNDAPTLPGAGAPFALSATDEDTASNGTLISDVVAGTLADPDPGAVGAAAIVATTGSGTWQFSVDGSTWTAFGTVGESQALLLSQSTLVRYVPNSLNGETAAFTYRAWDTTSGTASIDGNPSKTEIVSTGGTTAFSINTAQASINITDVNDAPTLPAISPVFSLPSTNEDTPSNGTLVSAILTSLTLADVDSGALSGVAVTNTTGNGSWQFSTDGVTWTDFGSVSASSALLLTSTAQIRYSPDALNGESATLTFRAWDRSSGTASVNGTPGKTSTDTNGGTTAFSTNTASAQITVTDVNDAPVLVPGSPFELAGTDSITASPASAVSVLLTGVSDVDPAPLTGIAVTATDGFGVWQYSTDGNTWTAFPTVSNSTALLLSSSSFVRFNPDGAHIENPTFTFRAWDRTTGTASTNGVPATSDTTSSGGTTAFSTATAQATTEVSNINHAPKFTAGPDVTRSEDATAQTITGWATAIAPGPASESGQVLNFVLTGNTNAALFSAGPTVNPITGDLTFTPAPNANGSATITLVLHDNGGTDGGGVDASAAQSFNINITSVNDAPTLTASNPPIIEKDAGAQSIPNFATATTGPANESAQIIEAFLVTNLTNAALFAVAPSVAADGTLTYTPAAGAHGSATFDLQARDSGGTANGGVNLSLTQTIKIRIGQTFSKSIKLAPITDADGTIVTFTLAGNGTAQLVEEVDGSFSLGITGADTTTKLTVKTKKSASPGDDGLATLADVQVDGSLSAFTAKTADLTSSFSATGSVTSLGLHDITGTAINIGPAASATTALAFSAAHITDTSLTSSTPFKSLAALGWLDTGSPETLTAPFITSLKITGAFAAGLQLTGPALPGKPLLNAATITGAIGPSDWNIAGNAGKITVGSFDTGWHGAFSGSIAALSVNGDFAGNLEANAITTLTVKGSLESAAIELHQTGAPLGLAKLNVTGGINNSTILADGSLGALSAASISNSRIFAAYGNSDSTLPLDLVELGGGLGNIASLTIKGPASPSFTNSFVVASTITKISLKVVDGSGPAVFGIAAHTIGSYARTGGTPLPNPHTDPLDYDTLDNFVLRVV